MKTHIQINASVPSAKEKDGVPDGRFHSCDYGLAFTNMFKEEKMKGCAKFLNFIGFLVFLFFLICFIGACAAAAVIGIKPDLIPQDLFDALTELTINGKPVTMEILAGFKIPVLIILGAAALILLLTLLIIANIRTALGEVGRGDPFSSICSKALSTAGTLEIVSGLLSIALSIYVTYSFGGMSINGGAAISFTANLSFILIAVFLKMLAGISEFGHR